MSIVSRRFPYKERRVGKITEIGLTWLTSTPLNPYGSRAETCQPEPVISAACQGHGNDPAPRMPAGKTGTGCGSALWFPKRPYKRKKKNFYCLPFYRGRRGGFPVPVTLPSPVAGLVVITVPCSTNHRLGLTCLSPTASRAEGGVRQSCQPDFGLFSLLLLFIGKSG